MNPDVLKNAKEGLKKVEKIETPQLTRTPAQRYKDLEARLDEMNRSGEGSRSDPQKSEAPVPSSEGQKPPYRKYCRRVSHASCFSESVPSIPKSKCLEIDTYSFGQSLHGVFTPLYLEVHHVDRNRQRPSCTRPRGQHSWQSERLSPEGMNRCRVPLFPVRESPSAITGRARILILGLSEDKRYPFTKGRVSYTIVIRALTLKTPPTRVLVVALWSVSRLRLRDFLHLFDYFILNPNESSMYEGVSQAVRALGRFPAPASSLFRRVFDNLAVVWSPLFEAGVLDRWGFLFLNQFGCVSSVGLTFMSWLDQDGWKDLRPLVNVVCGFLTKEIPPFLYAISLKFCAARHSPRPRTGSNRHSRICSPIHFHYVTQPNPPPHVPKLDGCSSFPAPSFSTYAGGTPYMTSGGRKPLHYWYRGQKVASSICSRKEHLEASFCLYDATERKPLGIGSKISLSPPLPVSILVDSLLPSSRKRLVRPFCVAFFCDPPLHSAITSGSPCGCSATDNAKLIEVKIEMKMKVIDSRKSKKIKEKKRVRWEEKIPALDAGRQTPDAERFCGTRETAGRWTPTAERWCDLGYTAGRQSVTPGGEEGSQTYFALFGEDLLDA
ncbi:hypothetical protein V8G54_032743 [Vigna mungo]|uniref:Uncharacterized protein n=1 Tax=Vigna mungo TaxID=3915 RepID=A0AAQ3RJ34_VIGMU